MGSTKNTPLASASDDEIRNFCEMLQLDLSKARKRTDLIAVLGAAWQHDYIPTSQVQEAQAEEEHSVQAEQVILASPVAQQRAIGGAGANDPIVRLKIQKTALPGGKDPVPVSVNGVAKVIQRELVADVPYRFYIALVNAMRAEVTQDQSDGEIHTDEVTNYPFQIISFPSDEAIADFHARTDNELMPA